MKLKRFLALVVSLSMVLSIVPAFSITASAAQPSYDPSSLISMADYSFIGDTTYSNASSWSSHNLGESVAESTNWAGWTSTSNTVRLYYISDLFIAPDYTESAITWTTNDTVKSGTADKDFMVITWNSTMGSWMDLGFTDQNGTLLDTFRYTHASTDGINYHYAYDGWPYNYYGPSPDSYTWEEGSNGYGSGSSGTTYAVAYENDEDKDGYTASYYYLNDSSYVWIGTKTFATGTVNGFNQMTFRRVQGNARIHNFSIYAGDYPAETKTAGVQYTIDGTAVDALAKSQTYVPTTYPNGYTFSEVYYSPNGTNTLYYAAEKTVVEGTETIEMTAVTNTSTYAQGTTVTVDENDYVITTGENLIPNGDFTYDLEGWYAATTTDESPVYATTSMVTLNGDGTITNNVNKGSGDASSLYRAWKLEVGKSYIFTMTSSATLTNGGLIQGSNVNYQVGDEAEYVHRYVNGTNIVPFTATSDYIKAYFGWSNGTTFGNFGLYEVTPQYDSFYVTVTGAGTNDYTNQEVEAFAVEEVPVPYFEGYVLAGRTVSGQYITYTYEATEASLGSWAIRNNVDNNEYIAEMKFLGSHNAFANTGADDMFVNEGGELVGTYGADPDSIRIPIIGTSVSRTTTAELSRTQTLSALEQLNAGVRYFDIRLSRQEDGSFATVHGPAFNYFRPIAYTIAQWAKENPGEVILLDFQTMVDALYEGDNIVDDGDGGKNGETAGDDNEAVYAALVDLLEEAGIMDYVYYTGTGWDTRYGSLTNNGTRTAIVLIGKQRLSMCDNRFVDRKTYTSNETTYTEDDDFDTVVSHIDSKYSSITSYRMFGYIHAYTTTAFTSAVLTSGANIVEDAEANNPNWANQPNFAAWMGRGKGDIFMINNVTEEIGLQYLAYLDKWNRDCYDEKLGNDVEGAGAFVSNGVTLSGAASIMPYSTEFVVTTGTPDAVFYTIDGVECTALTKYALEFNQFDTNPVSLTGDVTLTFETPHDITKVYAIVYNGEKFGDFSAAGGDVTVTVAGGLSAVDVTLVEKEAPYVEVTVNYVYNSETVGTDVEKVYGVTEVTTLTVENGVYAKQYYLDSAVDATVTNDVCNVEVAPLTLFTWEASSNSAQQTNGTYNAARAVYWSGNVSGNRTGYAYATVPEVGEDQTLIMTLDVMFNNGFNRNNVPYVTFHTVDRTALESIDLAGGSDTTTALAALASTQFAAFDMYDTSIIEGGACDSVVDANGDTRTHAIITIPVTGVSAGDIAVKMLDNGSQTGIAVINGISFEVGCAITVDGGDESYVKLGNSTTVKPAESAVALSDGEGNFFVGEQTITPVKNMDLYSVSFGADMVTGAQVRIGDGVDGDGKVTDGSGLRFITTVNTADSLAYEVYANYYDAETNTYAEGYDIGVIITAEGSDVSVKVSATKWQDAYATDNAFVYTSALTNLAESNFNRKFKAVPYVTVNGVDVVGDTECERSIYQVAAGLLVNSSTDNTSYDQTALESEILYKVLNAYVNQTGIRLSLSDTDEDGEKEFTARTTGSGAYSGDVFFTVGETTVSGDVYTVTLTPVGEKTEILDYWNGYVRINNNNGQIYVATTLTYNEADGTYTLEFDASKVKSN